MRVRFAPSPTGHLHVGGARTALFNWLLARREGGVFALRIEDTDRDRSSEEHTRAILHGLEWLGLTWDEGPVFQSEGLERHQGDVETLVASGHAYRDFTTPEEFEAERTASDRDVLLGRRARERSDAMAQGEAEERAAEGEPHAVRFRVPGGDTSWDDLVHGPTRFDNAAIDDFVILRADRTPIYNMAVVSDDSEMGITHVLRGDDHLSNTPKQILLYQALERPVPRFAHLPMILGPDGKRLSKRHGATSLGEYERAGILPSAMVNFLALLGWSPGDDREIMDLDELVAAFSLERVLKKSAVFDVKKLEWLSGQHLARADARELEPAVTALLVERRLADAAEVRARMDRYLALIDLLKVRSRTLTELAAQTEPYLVEEVAYDPDARRKHWDRDPEEAAARLEAVARRLESCEWTEEALEAAIRGLADEVGLAAGKVIHPLRVALTGLAASPGIFQVLALLGRERSLARVRRAVATLRSPHSVS